MIQPTTAAPRDENIDNSAAALITAPRDDDESNN